MRKIWLVIAVLAAGPAMAQSVNQSPSPPRSSQKPVDNGPTAPESNQAYQGGGVVLQGAPGAPPPAAQPTPPGQAPANSVQKP
jgi:hypothetical protein